jgi:uncharacterized protein YndB with AHSA1/START domain
MVQICLLAAMVVGQAAGEPLEHQGVLPVPVEKAWALFTTTEGLKKWVAEKAECDFRVGGAWRSSYDPTSNLKDDKTIVNSILAYDPMKMIAMQCTQTPAGFPWPEEFKKCWTVIYLDKVEGGTKVTFRSFGYPDTENGHKLRDFFKAGNQQVMDELVAAAKKG